MAGQQHGFAGNGPGQQTGEHDTSENLVDLVRQLTFQGSHLAEQQLNLVQAEIREAAEEVKAAVAGMMGAAVVGIAGLGVTLMGIAYLVGGAINHLGWGTLIVGVAALILAAILFNGARSKMRATHLTPERTRRTLERTPDVVRGDLHAEHNS